MGKGDPGEIPRPAAVPRHKIAEDLMGPYPMARNLIGQSETLPADTRGRVPEPGEPRSHQETGLTRQTMSTQPAVHACVASLPPKVIERQESQRY